MMSVGLIAIFMLAQPTQPSRIEPRGALALVPPNARISEGEAQRIMIEYATCVARRSRSRVEQYLRAAIGSPEATRLASRLATGDCLRNGNLRFRQPLFRGSLYNALYYLDYGQRAIADFSTVAAVSYAPEGVATLDAHQQGWLALHDFADCVVRAGPADARTLVMSRATSGEETRAFASLQPRLGVCLVDGAQLGFSRPILRGLIAESLYRLSVSAQAAPAARR